MSKAITYFIVATMLLGMPHLLGTLTVTNISPGEITPLTQASQEIMKSMNSLINTMSYLGGIAFAMKGVLCLKKHLEGGNFNQESAIKIEQPIIKQEEAELNIVMEEFKKIEFKFNLDFENKLLNTKLVDIEKVINSIVELPVLENNIENKILVSSTQEKYIKQIHKAYISIPKELRDKKIKNSTATALAMQQLILVENGLIEIENELLSQQIKDLNIMNRFLKEKFPEEKKYLSVKL